MPTTVQFRRGTTAQNNAFTGANGEISVDTDDGRLVLHDGSTAGGTRQALASETIFRVIADDSTGIYLQGGTDELRISGGNGIVTSTDSWVSADNLGWTFPRSFVIGVELDTINNVLMNIDRDGAPSSNSFVNFGGWEPWSTFVVDTDLDDGEFGIRATVSTVGSGLTPQFKVYRSPYPGLEEYDLVFNWSSIGSNTQYFDQLDINPVLLVFHCQYIHN